MEGTIDQLNFEVILNDKQFTKAIQKDLEAANELNVKLSTVLNLKKKLNSAAATQAINAEKVRAAEAKAEEATARAALAQQKVATEMERTKAAAEGYAGAVGAANSRLTNTSNIMRTISQLTGVVFGVAGLRRFMSSLIDITGQFEVQRMALRNMLQDVDGADKIFQDLYQFSSDSTYRFSELAKYAKQLAAFDIGKDSLLETTKMLGDVASGVGVSMDRLILAYGHVKSSGFLRGIQLRSFSQNGVPVLEELSRMFTEIEGKAVSLGDVFDKMMKREIPFEMVEQAFQRMTSEGGKFYQMQEVLAKTLAGQINILKGRWENMLAAVGNANSGILKNTVTAISEAISNYENFGKYLKELIAAFGVYQTTLILATVATKGFTTALDVGLLGALKRVALALAANPYALLAAGVTAAVAALYKLTTRLTEAEKIQQVLTKGSATYTKNLTAEIVELDRLYTKLGLLKKGTQEYDSAKRAIESRFGPYIQELQNEGKAVDDLASSYDLLKGKIEAAARARALEMQTQDLKSQLDKSADWIEKQFSKSIKKVASNLSGAQTEILSSYVYGLVGDNDPQMRDIYRQFLKEFGAAKTLDVFGKLKGLRNEYKDAFDAYTKGVETVTERYEKLEEITSEGGKKVQKNLEGWRKAVADITEGLNTKTLQETGLVAKEDEDYYEYLERIGKKYKDLREEKDKALKVNKGQYDEWINAIKKVDKALEGNILADVRYNKSPWRDSGSGNDDAEKVIKARISNLQKLKSVYDDLAENPLIGGENARTLMGRFYGVEDVDFEGQIRGLADQLIRLNPQLAEYVEGIKAAFGKDAASEYIKSLSALDSVDEKIAGYLAKNFSVDGEKVGYKISKAFTDLFNKNVKVDLDIDKIVKDLEKAGDAVRTNYLVDNAELFKDAGISEEEQERLADVYWDEYKRRRIAELREQAEQEKAANNKATEERVKGFASEIYKELTKGLDLSDWAHKSLREINDIIQRLGEINLPDEIKEKLKDYPELLGELSSALGELADADMDKANQKKWEKVAKGLQKAATALKPAIEAMRGLGDAMGDQWLSDMADHLQNLVSTTSSFVDAMAKGDPLSAYTAAISYAVSEVMGLISANVELRRNIRETAEEARRQSLADALSRNVDSIFGTNDLRKVDNAIASIKELKRLTNVDRADNREMNISKQSKWWEFFLTPTATTAWAKLFSSQMDSLPGMASKLGMSLYDQYGNLNADTLNAILDTYKDLKQADREWIQSAIVNSEAYANAMEQLDDVMESLFGDIASSTTDAIVSGWLDAQNAALDYADILDDVAQSYAKMLVKSMILDEVLNDDAVKAVKEAFVRGDSTEAMAMIEESLQRIADMEPAFREVMESFEPYFSREGSESTSVSSGIKGISEDTANLLASYINAMRADLSVVRAMQTTGWQDVKAIREAMQGQYTPNYNEYMAQIAANTFDTAQSNQEILSRIRSVITSSPSGGSAVRMARS